MARAVANRLLRLLTALTLLSALAIAAHAGSGLGSHSDRDRTTRLRLEVTGADGNKPVGNASVYVRFQQGHKTKLTEMNLKTNQDGSVKVPEIPRGKVLIQIVAPGWKTFGQWYELNEDQETIKIQLQKPPHWY